MINLQDAKRYSVESKRMRISYAVAIAASHKPNRSSNLNPRHEDDPNDDCCGRYSSIYTNNIQTNIVNYVLLSPNKVFRLLPEALS